LTATKSSSDFTHQDYFKQVFMSFHFNPGGEDIVFFQHIVALLTDFCAKCTRSN